MAQNLRAMHSESECGHAREISVEISVMDRKIREGERGAMAKQGQHQNDHRDQDKSRGHNNPKKSTPITTGTYKKPETRRKQAIAHEDTDSQAQDARNEWHDYDDPALKNISKRDRVGDSARSGSDSNSDR